MSFYRVVVLPWEVLGETVTPDGTALALTRRGSEYVILANGKSLMSNRMHGSEEALADFGMRHLASLPRHREPHVLVGGLGMGYTLRAALDSLLQVAAVRTSKLEPTQERLERIIEKVTTVGGRVDALATRLGTIDERTRELEALNGRIQTLTTAVDSAEAAIKRTTDPGGEIQMHRATVERLTAEAREAHTVLDRIAQDRASLEELRAQLRATEQAVKQGHEQASALTNDLDKLRGTTTDLQTECAQLRELSQSTRASAAGRSCAV